MMKKLIFTETILPLLLVTVLTTSLMVNANQLRTLYSYPDNSFVNVAQVVQADKPAQARATIVVSGNRLIEVNGGASVASSFAWKIEGTVDYKIVDAGKTLLVLDPENTVTVYLAVAIGDSVDLTSVSIEPKGVPRPAPTFKESLSVLIKDVAVKQDEKKNELRDIATAFKSVAELIKDGTVTTVEKAVELTKKLVNRAVRDHPTEWSPVIAALEAHAEKQADAGKLATLKDHPQVWDTIANTLYP